MLKDKQPEESDGKRIVFHRNSKHPEYESKDCPECLRCLEEFKQAEADGTLTKELASVEESNWREEFSSNLYKNLDEFMPEKSALRATEIAVQLLETELTKAHNQAIDRAVATLDSLSSPLSWEYAQANGFDRAISEGVAELNKLRI